MRDVKTREFVDFNPPPPPFLRPPPPAPSRIQAGNTPFIKTQFDLQHKKTNMADVAPINARLRVALFARETPRRVIVRADPPREPPPPPRRPARRAKNLRARFCRPTGWRVNRRSWWEFLVSIWGGVGGGGVGLGRRRRGYWRKGLTAPGIASLRTWFEAI